MDDQDAYADRARQLLTDLGLDVGVEEQPELDDQDDDTENEDENDTPDSGERQGEEVSADSDAMDSERSKAKRPTRTAISSRPIPTWNRRWAWTIRTHPGIPGTPMAAAATIPTPSSIAPSPPNMTR